MSTVKIAKTGKEYQKNHMIPAGKNTDHSLMCIERLPYNVSDEMLF